MDEVEVVLRRIQQLEPAGVGARNLRECLLLQLRQMPADTPFLAEAQRLVGDHLDLLGSRDYSQLMRRMRVKEDELREIVELIQSLHPRPGSQQILTFAPLILEAMQSFNAGTAFDSGALPSGSVINQLLTPNVTGLRDDGRTLRWESRGGLLLPLDAVGVDPLMLFLSASILFG